MHPSGVARREVGRRAKVVRVPYGHSADPVGLGAPDCFVSGPRGDNLANAVPAIQDGHGAGIHDQFRLCHCMHDACTDTRHIPTQAHDAVGLMTPQIRPYQAVGNQMGIRSGKADGRKDGLGEGDQPVCSNRRSVH